MSEDHNTLLPIALSAAVPLWMDTIVREDWSFEKRKERAHICCELLCGPAGADVLFKSKKPGGTAEAFNRLAEALAICAMQPGGVKAFGEKWEEGWFTLTDKLGINVK